MKKKILPLIAVPLLTSAFLFFQTSAEGNVAEILQDGKVIERVDLSEKTDRSLTVFYEGRANQILIRGGSIRVEAADCPDKLCVKMGGLSKNKPPIVCLPNHLVIRFAED